jgi:hypothetical protein
MQKKKKVLVLQTCDSNYASMLSVGKRYNKQFAENFHYDYLSIVEDDKTNLLFLRYKHIDKLAKEYQYIFYIDTDAVVRDTHSTTVETLIDNIEQNDNLKDVVFFVAKEGVQYNNGVMLWNTNSSQFQFVIDRVRSFETTQRCDQAVLHQITDEEGMAFLLPSNFINGCGSFIFHAMSWYGTIEMRKKLLEDAPCYNERTPLLVVGFPRGMTTLVHEIASRSCIELDWNGIYSKNSLFPVGEFLNPDHCRFVKPYAIPHYSESFTIEEYEKYKQHIEDCSYPTPPMVHRDVVQPFIMRTYLEEYPEAFKVLFVDRPIEECKKHQERLGWGDYTIEKMQKAKDFYKQFETVTSAELLYDKNAIFDHLKNLGYFVQPYNYMTSPFIQKRERTLDFINSI